MNIYIIGKINCGMFLENYNSLLCELINLQIIMNDNEKSIEFEKTFSENIFNVYVYSTVNLNSNIININCGKNYLLDWYQLLEHTIYNSAIICYCLNTESKKDVELWKAVTTVLEKYRHRKYISNNNWETFKNKLMKIDRTTIILIAKNTNPITKCSPYEPHYKNLEQQTRKIINEMRISLLYDIFLQYLLPPNDNIFYIVLQNKNGQQFKTSIYQRDGTFIKQVYNKNVNVMKKYYLYFTLICLCITIFSIFFLQWYINNKGSIFNIIDNYHV